MPPTGHVFRGLSGHWLSGGWAAGDDRCQIAVIGHGNAGTASTRSSWREEYIVGFRGDLSCIPTGSIVSI